MRLATSVTVLVNRNVRGRLSQEEAMLKHAFLCTAFATALAVPLAAEQTGTPPSLQIPAQQLTETQIIDYSLVFPGGDAIGDGTVIHASAQRADGSQRPDQSRLSATSSNSLGDER